MKLYHKNRPSTIKPTHIRCLPDILDIISLRTDETLSQIAESSFDGFGVSFEGTFTPANDVIGCFDSDEEPSRGNAEDLIHSIQEIKWLKDL